jgi:hypothetical protein
LHRLDPGAQGLEVLLQGLEPILEMPDLRRRRGEIVHLAG